MIKNPAFYFNSELCTGCKACMIACIDKHNLNKGVLWRRVLEYSGGEWLPVGDAYEQNVFAYYVSLSCNHCENPACVAGCPTGAMFKSDDGTVLHIDDRCVVCRNCMTVCPYGAPQLDEDENMVVKCDSCKALRESGRNPVCVDACPMRALEFGDMDELRAAHGDAASELPLLPSPDLTHPNLLVGASPAALRTDFREVRL